MPPLWWYFYFYFLLFIFLFCHTYISKMKFTQEFRQFTQYSPIPVTNIVYCQQISTAPKIKHPTKSKRPKLPLILPSSQRSNAGSRSACSPSFAACSFGINNFYFVSFIYVAFLNFHVTLPPAPNRNRRQFFLPHRIFTPFHL